MAKRSVGLYSKLTNKLVSMQGNEPEFCIEPLATTLNVVTPVRQMGPKCPPWCLDYLSDRFEQEQEEALMQEANMGVTDAENVREWVFVGTTIGNQRLFESYTDPTLIMLDDEVYELVKVKDSEPS